MRSQTQVPLTLAAWRIRGAGVAAVALAAVGFAGILYLTRGFTFYYDEWDWVLGSPSWTWVSYLQPHNEHWSTIPMIIYKLLFSMVGARVYWPFMVPVLLAHAGTCLVLFRVVRRRSGDLPALLSIALMTFLGRGYENLLAAFQVTFVGSAFFGLLAIDLLDAPTASRRRLLIACLLLLLSLMCSGVGLFFLVAVAVDLVLDGSRRSRLITLVLPAAAYLAWFITFGRSAIGGTHTPLNVHSVIALRAYIPYGLGAVSAGLFGLDLLWAPLGGLILAAVLAAGAARRRALIDSRVVGALAGLGSQFVLAGLVRSQLGVAQAGSPRYIYNGSIFLLLALTPLLGALAWNRRVLAAAIAVTAVSVGLNGLALRQAAHDKNVQFNRERAELQTLEAFRGAPDLAPDTHADPVLMPNVPSGAYFAAIDRLGSPVTPVPRAQVPLLPAAAVDGVLRNVFGPAVHLGAGAGSGCATAPLPAVPESDWLRLDGPVSTLDVYLWYLGPEPAAPTVHLVAQPGQRLLRLPQTGSDMSWNVEVISRPPQEIEACSGP